MYEAVGRHRLSLCAPHNPLFSCHNVSNVPINRINLWFYFSCHIDCRKIFSFWNAFTCFFPLVDVLLLRLCSAVRTCAPVLYDKLYMRALCTFKGYLIDCLLTVVAMSWRCKGERRRMCAACTSPYGCLTFTITGNVFSDNKGKMPRVHDASFILHKGSHIGTQKVPCVLQAWATDIAFWGNIQT
jgi:hypothetical protein